MAADKIWGARGGTGSYGPNRNKWRIPGTNRDYSDWEVGWNKRSRTWFIEDFDGAAGYFTDNPRMTMATVQTGGAPTSSVRANVADGVWRGALVATNEIESARVSLADQLITPLGQRPIFQALIVPQTTLAANERLVVGWCSANNATLNNATYNVWFRLEGSMALKVEHDDNVTDKDLIDLGLTLVAGTPYLLTIDMNDPNAIRFFVGDNLMYTSTFGFVTSAATIVQPYAIVQKDSGVATSTLDVDFFYSEWDRTSIA